MMCHVGPQAQPEVQYTVQTSATDPFYLRMQSAESGPLTLPYCTGPVIVKPVDGVANFMASDMKLPVNVEVTNPTAGDFSLLRVWKAGSGHADFFPKVGLDGTLPSVNSMTPGIHVMSSTQPVLPLIPGTPATSLPALSSITDKVNSLLF